MLEIKSICNNTKLLVINNKTVLLLNTKSDFNEKYEYVHDVELTSGIYLPNRKLFAITDSNKNFYLIDTNNGNNILTKKLINKRASKLLSDSSESTIILGDKTGDVYSLNINHDSLENNEFKLIMGHLSMLTDIKLSLNEKYLFTSDRDEKIRISNYPNAYNIQGYLLGHKEFIAQIEFLDEKTLLSVSGDSCLITWDLNSLKQVQKFDIKKFVNEPDLNGIDKFVFNNSNNLLLLHLFKTNHLLRFNFDQNKNEFNYLNKLDFDQQIDDFVHLSNDYYLFLFLSQKSQFVIKKLENNQFVDLESTSNLKELESKLSEYVKFDDSDELKIEMEKNYNSFFKAIVNNMDDYYQRKQERILSNKRKHTESVSSDLSESKLIK